MEMGMLSVVRDDSPFDEWTNNTCVGTDGENY